MEISAHAAQRLLERAGEFTTDIRPLISPILAKAMITLGDGKYPLPGGFRAIVRNEVIVTIIPPNKHEQPLDPTHPAPRHKNRKRRSVPGDSWEAW